VPWSTLCRADGCVMISSLTLCRVAATHEEAIAIGGRNAAFPGGSGPLEKVFNEFWKPSRGGLGPRRGRKLLDDHKAVDFSLQVSF
jgi:hypothetical protein